MKAGPAVQEFYNRNHDRLGRFASGPSGRTGRAPQKLKVGPSGRRFYEDRHGNDVEHPESDPRRTLVTMKGKKVGYLPENSGALEFPGQVHGDGRGKTWTKHGEPPAVFPLPKATHTKAFLTKRQKAAGTSYSSTVVREGAYKAHVGLPVGGIGGGRSAGRTRYQTMKDRDARQQAAKQVNAYRKSIGLKPLKEEEI